MKLTCNGLDLAESFSKVIKAITGKKAIPILEGVKISAFGDTLTLTATDMDFTIVNKIRADIKLEGEAVVQGRFAAELVRKMSSQSIELDNIDDKQLVIKYLDSETKINCMNIDEFPLISDLNYDITIPIKRNQFKDIVNKTIFAASTEDARPVLKSCYMKVEKDLLTFVALDGYRIAISKTKLDKEYPDCSIVIPSRALAEISKLIDDSDELMIMNITNKKFMVDLDHTVVVTSLIEERYINYSASIPKDFSTEFTVIREQLDEGLDRASLMSRREKSNLIEMDVRENVLTMKAADQNLGQIQERVAISMNGVDIKIGLNSRYLNDCIKAIGDEYIKISIVNTTKPVVVTPIEGDSFYYLMMPVRLNGAL